MLRTLKFLVVTIILISLISLAINIPALYTQYTTTRKIGKVMIKYGQKNGGFMATLDEYGEIKYTAQEKMKDILAIYNMEEKIEKIEYIPGLDIPVQKRSKFSIFITPKIEVHIPFYGAMTFKARSIEEYGYSHKYFKGL